MDIRKKIVIVTGASSGIGLATARLLAERGAKVALVSRDAAALEKIAKEIPDSFVAHADMTKDIEIRDMVEAVEKHFGRIDILINNAGQGYDAPVEKTDIATFRRIFELDVVGPLVAMQCVIPLMRKQGGGAIVNISSGTALMHLPNMGAYSGLKSALAGISLTAREELKTDNIAVSVVYPYSTLTNFEINTIKDFVENENGEQGGSPPPPDTAGYVAEKIVEGIETGKAEVFAHEWMERRAVT